MSVTLPLPAAAVTVPVLDRRLGIFTLDASGGGQATIVNEDGGINSPLHPAPRSSVVSIYATGGGQTDPPGTDGAIAGDALAKLKSGIGLIILTIFDLAVMVLIWQEYKVVRQHVAVRRPSS